MLPSLDVVVVGSANLDVRLQVAELPRAGETVLARGRDLGAGGKGANQAVAAARVGASTAFLGAVGDDDAGRSLLFQLDRAGVMTALVRRLSRPTGTAYVVVEESGENLIVVEPGANGAMVDLTPEELAVVRSARVVLCQLEVPVPTIVQAAAAAGGIVVLNAAPAAGLAADALEHVNVLVVNENEAETLAGGAANAVDAVEILLRRVSVVVVTRGPDGVLLAQRDREPAHVPATPARRVVDTTGAGDTFCGALAAALARSDDVGGAIRRAAVAGSLSVERAGAGESAPSAAEIKARLAELERGES